MAIRSRVEQVALASLEGHQLSYAFRGPAWTTLHPDVCDRWMHSRLIACLLCSAAGTLALECFSACVHELLILILVFF